MPVTRLVTRFAMPRDGAIIFSDLTGKLDLLYIVRIHELGTGRY
jgi:hypothetical protein